MKEPSRRLARRLSANRPSSWLLAHTLHHVDKPVFRLTRGKHTVSSVVTGIPVVMLGTTGARSGVSRTVPVLGVSDGDRIVVVASGYGRGEKPPAWYFNLRTNPGATVTADGVTRSVEAYEAVGDEKERLWRQAVGIYPGFAEYRKRANGRRSMPVMVLSPL